jgi:FGGY-family pentulose kinase
MTDALFVGIDVGTGSARAAIFDARGQRLGLGSCDFELWKPAPGFVEQSSTAIWAACCHATRTALDQAGVDASRVVGIGFDATCSMVLVGEGDSSLPTRDDGEPQNDVIVWMDHRAKEQADRINEGEHEVLRYVGGRISPEMQTPKLLWLRENAPQTWQRLERAFDLPDWLGYRATGDDSRSLCTTVCKWTYLGHESRWDEGYFRAIGLGELADEGFARIGTQILPMGQALGQGLTARAAQELGLPQGCAVSVGIIDAHAGGIGLLGCGLQGAPFGEAQYDRRLALIGGTSTCHMAVSKEPRYVPGVWGPYHSAMLPGLWLTEGGQSATGALIDHVIDSHARGATLRQEAAEAGSTAYALLNARLQQLAKGRNEPLSMLTCDLHVYPDFHGNRSPRADAHLRGMLSGLALDDSIDALALQYLATIQALALGTQHILQALREQGYAIDTLIACGGDTKNELFVQEHANATGCALILPEEPEAVLLGSAMLGAVAAGAYADIPAAMSAMSGEGRRVEAQGAPHAAYFDRKFAVMQRMHDDQKIYAAEMRRS